MQETLIEFETGKLAKEKNFNIPCDARWWMEFGSWKESKKGAVKCKNSEEYSISRPTQSLLAKWLREFHGIPITVIHFPKYDNDGIVKYIEYRYSIIEKNEVWEETLRHKTYEEALEIGLQEGLKLIKTEEF
jgi:hypothetical protein